MRGVMVGRALNPKAAIHRGVLNIATIQKCVQIFISEINNASGGVASGLGRALVGG